MSGVFASVSTPVISLYATTESPTEDNEESPNTTDENEEAQILQTRMYLRLMIISLTIHCPSLKMERSLVPWDR